MSVFADTVTHTQIYVGLWLHTHRTLFLSPSRNFFRVFWSSICESDGEDVLHVFLPPIDPDVLSGEKPVDHVWNEFLSMQRPVFAMEKGAENTKQMKYLTYAFKQ